MIHSKHQQSTHQQHQQQNMRKSVGVMGTRRIFTTVFKIKVLDSYRHDKDCRQNQRATARKYGIHRRQIQKWLQCEEQLRSSVENGNTGTASTISPAGSQSDGAVTEVTGNTVTPATPALNLNLARQHGDELATQQGPPPPHPPHGSAPSSPQYSRPAATIGTTLPLCVASVSYQEYSSEQQRLHLELDDRVHMPEIHAYPGTQVDQDRNYYVLNGDGQRDVEAASVFGSRNEVKVYQTLTSYHSPSREHRYDVNDVNSSARNHHSPNHHSRQREQSYGNVDSFDGRSYGLLLAPSMIKTEPASPDTAATSGPYKSTDSPGGPRAPLSSPPISHRAADSGDSPSSVHFVDSSRAPASPYLHVHVHEHAHPCSPLNSEKPIPSLLHQRERESEETTRQIEEKREEETLEKTEYCTAMVKEEVHLDEEEIYDEGEEAVASSCIDYRRPPTGESLAGSLELESPMYDRNGYSLPSSPRDSVSVVGRYRSSCSDSEMDPLASAGSFNSSGNFTRRRSFPLRFKLDVLDAFHRDKEVKENQRATARKFGINRRQVQKWLEQEAELRDEIALRGDSRQRLGPVQDPVASGDSPLDLTTTTNYVPSYVSLLRDRFEMERERSHFYRCDFSPFSPQHPSHYQHPTKMESTPESEPVGPCNLSCSVDSHATSTTSSYQESSYREFCSVESSVKTHCYSPRANSEVSNLSEGCEQRFSPLKRQHCVISCCYDATPSPKRFCERFSDVDDCYDAPPQDAPLCLVKPRPTREPSPSRTELKPNAVSTSNNPDAITFKPYLDNPVSKPAKRCADQRDPSPVNSHNVNNNNNNNSSYNNNCQIICNLNENQNRNYDYELNLRVPVSWRPDIGLYTGFPQGSAFVSVSSLYM